MAVSNWNKISKNVVTSLPLRDEHILAKVIEELEPEDSDL
jgi:hypothetical protein